MSASGVSRSAERSAPPAAPGTVRERDAGARAGKPGVDDRDA
ncbi:hypothetical protein [Microbacterium marinilacus]|nr:hypothetical protein [Microbacterium marinilacus]